MPLSSVVPAQRVMDEDKRAVLTILYTQSLSDKTALHPCGAKADAESKT